MTGPPGRAVLLLLALAAFGGAAGDAGAAQASERRYVIEQLVVSVSADAGGGERVGQLKSGAAVDLLERQGESARVRLASGTAGWVKASYLSAELPLRERLAARERELDELRAKLAATAKPVAPVAPVAPAAAAPPAAAAAAAAAAVTPAAPAAPAALAPWQAVLGVGLAGLGLGFLIGWWALDRRIRARYGGLKIY